MSLSIDKPLEDLISQNKKKGRGRGRGRGGRGRGTNAKPNTTAKRGRGRTSNRAANRNSGRGRGRGRSGRGNRTNRSGGISKPMPYSRPQQLPEKWSHDMFEGVNGRDLRATMGVQAPTPSYQATMLTAGTLAQSSLSTGTRAVITNLDSNVNEQDLEELFGAIGPLKKVEMTAPGVAEVIFTRRTDAEKAHAQYNQVLLDGRPMYIEVEAPVVSQSAPQPTSATARLGGPKKGRGNVKFTVHM